MSDRMPHLEEIAARDELAGDEFFASVYRELRQLAARQLRGESSAHTLQPTALVHEAYLRIVDRNSKVTAAESNSIFGRTSELGYFSSADFERQSDFFVAAALAMRRILVDHARRKKRLKRGADWKRVPIDLNGLSEESSRRASPDYLLSLDEAISQLKQTDPTAAELVHLRYFAGLSVEQAADALGISPRTASRTWNYARAWLFERISGENE